MDVSSETVAETFLQKVQTAPPEERWFVGAEFENLSLNYRDVMAETRHPIHLHHSTFRGQLNISFATFQVHLVVSHCQFDLLDAVSVEFNYECYFAESDIERANFRAASFADYVEFDGSTIGQVRFTSVQFDGGTSFEETVFEAESDFSFSSFERGSNFRAAEFRNVVHFVRTEVENVEFSDVRFENGVDFTQAEFDNASFDAVFDQVSFEDAKFHEEIDLTAATRSDELVVDMSGAVVSEGRIVVQRDDVDRSPSDGPDGDAVQAAVYFDLTRATLGRVALESDSDNVFDHVIVTETDFDGFDFARYADALYGTDWRLHTSSAPREPTDFHSIEITYTKAKEAAHVTGNIRAASKFFRSEMRYRRKGYLEGLRATSSTGRKLQFSGKAVANYLLDVLSGYGERPWRVVGISIGVIFACAALYPFLGGIRETSSEGSSVYAFEVFSGVPAIPFPEWMATFGRSFYFSVVTFTTLGYGDLQPASAVVRLVASMEAFVGALLMALLVFVLGRSVRW